MTEQRQQEIALMLLKQRFRDQGINISSSLPEEIGDQAKKIGIETKEAMEFAEITTRELMNEVFTSKF
ncbi:MAG: hypothetical protein WD335_02755 [Candidatus Paceibacterota bacterium]